MKYLKLYEDFNSSDILEDIKWIMIEVSEDAKLISSELDGDLLFYNLNTDCSEEDLKVAKLRLNDLDYNIIKLKNKETQFLHIKKVDLKNKTFYRK